MLPFLNGEGLVAEPLSAARPDTDRGRDHGAGRPAQGVFRHPQAGSVLLHATTLVLDPDAVKKRLRKDGVPAMLAELELVLAQVEPFDLATLERPSTLMPSGPAARWATWSTRCAWPSRGRGLVRVFTTACPSWAATPVGPGSGRRWTCSNEPATP